MSKVAIVAALEREVRPLIRSWRVTEKGRDGRRFRFFEHEEVVMVCGGIGAAAARRAAEAVIAIYAPEVIYSAGFAGALDAALKVGDIVQPGRVVDASDGSSVSLEGGEGVLVTFASIADTAQKAKLRDSFSAQAVDMEAAAVARAADARGVGFAVVKVISDEADFVFPSAFPSVERFIDPQGHFLEGRFAAFAAIRPWLWHGTYSLARNSSRAANALCHHLSKLNESQTSASAGTLEAVGRQ
jgi:adenosylhomocysteine nucleosidase